MLGCEVRSPFPQIQDIIDAKEPFDKLWRAVVTFHDNQDEWLTGPILKLNAEEIEEMVTRIASFKFYYIFVHIMGVSSERVCNLS